MKETAPHILIISHDVVGRHMAGPGIRYSHLARVLAQEFRVLLAAPAGSTLERSPDFSVMVYAAGGDAPLEAAVRQARTVFVPAIAFAGIPSLRSATTPVIIDGYNPISAEALHLKSIDVRALQAAMLLAYWHGDFFVCASERQRDWWLGLLEASGRINAETHADDASLRRLIDLVPFGLPDWPAKHTRAIIKGVWPGVAREDRVMVWGGGLWSWLDPLTAIRAVAQLRPQWPSLRLVFPGTQHPNPRASASAHTEAARALAGELGVLNQAVFFGDWVPYEDWPNVLLESDLALSLHFDTLETRLAYRSRVLDYIWGEVPIVSTNGDAASELVTRYGLGRTVGYADVEGVRAAIQDVLMTPRSTFQRGFAAARAALTWERAAQPLLDFCRQPHLAPDKARPSRRLLPSLEEIDRLLERTASQEQEATALRAHLQAVENTRVMRVLRWFDRWRRSAQASS